MTKSSYISALLLVLFTCPLGAQSYDHSPTLTPIWARLGDVYGENGDVESVEFSPDARYIVSGTKYDNQVVLWRTSDGVEMWRYDTGHEIERAGFSPNGELIAVASEDFKVRLLDSKTGEMQKEIKLTQGIDGLVFSHNGKWLAAGEEQPGKGKEGLVHIFEMPGAKLKHTKKHKGTVNSLDFTKDDRYLLSLGGNTVVVWDTQTFEAIHTLKSEMPALLITARFSPDGNLVAAGDNDGNVLVWDWKEEKLVRRFNSSGMKIEIVDWAPTGKYLVTGGFDNYLRIYRTDHILSKNKYLPPVGMYDMGSFIEYLDFSPNGELICTANQDGSLRLWVFMKNDANEADRRHRQLKKKQKATVGSKQ